MNDLSLVNDVAQNIRNELDNLDQNTCVKNTMVDELGFDSINHLGFIAGIEEREILLEEEDYLYNSGFKVNHFQGELRGDKIVGSSSPSLNIFIPTKSVMNLFLIMRMEIETEPYNYQLILNGVKIYLPSPPIKISSAQLQELFLNPKMRITHFLQR